MLGDAPAEWYPDPSGRHEVRYWDGSQWTEHVASKGVMSADSSVEPTPVANDAYTPPGWYADPYGTTVRRYWDGRQWTQHFEPARAPAVVVVPTAQPPTDRVDKKVQRQVRNLEIGDIPAGGGTILTEHVLVVNRNARRSRSMPGYSIYDKSGRRLGSVRKVPRELPTPGRGRGALTATDQYEVVDLVGGVLLAMVRPQKGFGLGVPVPVEGPDGAPIGQITRETTGTADRFATLAYEGLSLYPRSQRIWGFDGLAGVAQRGIGGAKGFAVGAALDAAGMSRRLSLPTEKLDGIGHIRFGLDANGQRIGSIRALSTAQLEFAIQDTAGSVVGLITDTRGASTKEKPAAYVVQIQESLTPPIRHLAVAAAVFIDRVLKQGSA